MRNGEEARGKPRKKLRRAEPVSRPEPLLLRAEKTNEISGPAMKKVLLLIIVLAVGGYAYYHYYTTTPRYSLQQAHAAVQAHDPAAFSQYVDVESVASHLLDDLSKQRGLLSLINPGSWALKGLGALVKPQLAKATKAQVDTFIETGSIAEARQAGGGKLSLAALLGRVVSDSSEFEGVTYENVLNNGAAEVGLAFSQPRYDTTLVVNLRLQDRGDHWQVTEIVRPEEILQHVSRLEKQRLIESMGKKRE